MIVFILINLWSFSLHSMCWTAPRTSLPSIRFKLRRIPIKFWTFFHNMAWHFTMLIVWPFVSTQLSPLIILSTFMMIILRWRDSLHGFVIIKLRPIITKSHWFNMSRIQFIEFLMFLFLSNYSVSLSQSRKLRHHKKISSDLRIFSINLH